MVRAGDPLVIIASKPTTPTRQERRLAGARRADDKCRALYRGAYVHAVTVRRRTC